MRRVVAAVAVAVATCLAATGCVFGDVWHLYGIVNDCGAALEVTFDSSGYYQQHPDATPDQAAIVPASGEGSIGMLSGDTLTVVAREHGGQWAEAGTVTSEQLKEGGPLTISGGQCPPAGPDPRETDPLMGTYPFLEGSESVTWLAYLDSDDDTPESEGPVTSRVAIVATGDQEWFDQFLARGSDWREADLPALPEVILADVPPGTWAQSRSVGPKLQDASSASLTQVFVNRDARAVLVRAVP